MLRGWNTCAVHLMVLQPKSSLNYWDSRWCEANPSLHRPAFKVPCNLASGMQTAVSRLMAFGAVYYCPVHPPSTECRLTNLSEEDASRLDGIHEEGIAKHGTNVRTHPSHSWAVFECLHGVSRASSQLTVCAAEVSSPKAAI
jgi:hypothetical protein